MPNIHVSPGYQTLVVSFLSSSVPFVSLPTDPPCFSLLTLLKVDSGTVSVRELAQGLH